MPDSSSQAAIRVVQIGDRGQRVGARALDPAPAVEVVDHRHLVPARREPKCRRPAEVAVATEDEDPHRPARLVESGRCQTVWWPETAADGASRRWSRSCCWALGLRVGEAWDGRAPVFDAAAYAAIARNLDEGNGFTVGARRDPAELRLLPRPAPLRRRHLQGDRRRPRTPRAPRPRPDRRPRRSSSPTSSPAAWPPRPLP